jgi:Zn-finger nucleic acid-binding protein
MKCPACKDELTPNTIGKIEIDECVKCKGIWFDDDELRQAKDISGKDLNWMDFEIWKHEKDFKLIPGNRACPKCIQYLVSMNYADKKIEIDCCPKCKGVWLDENEFKNIIDALTKEMYTKDFGEYIKAAIEEAQEIITGPESFSFEYL